MKSRKWKMPLVLCVGLLGLLLIQVGCVSQGGNSSEPVADTKHDPVLVGRWGGDPDRPASYEFYSNGDLAIRMQITYTWEASNGKGTFVNKISTLLHGEFKYTLLEDGTVLHLEMPYTSLQILYRLP